MILFEAGIKGRAFYTISHLFHLNPALLMRRNICSIQVIFVGANGFSFVHEFFQCIELKKRSATVLPVLGGYLILLMATGSGF